MLAEWQGFISDGHFSVDGSLIDAWASHKSFVRKDGSGPDRPSGRNPSVDFSGEKRSNATHESTTDGEAAKWMIGRTIQPGATVGAEKGYDTADFVSHLQGLGIKAHVARKVSGSAVDGRTARGKGYTLSLMRRKMIEEAFGWIKAVGGLRKTRHKGVVKLAGQALLCFAAYNLTRLQSLPVLRMKLLPTWGEVRPPSARQRGNEAEGPTTKGGKARKTGLPGLPPRKNLGRERKTEVTMSFSPA